MLNGTLRADMEVAFWRDLVRIGTEFKGCFDSRGCWIIIILVRVEMGVEGRTAQRHTRAGRLQVEQVGRRVGGVCASVDSGGDDEGGSGSSILILEPKI